MVHCREPQLIPVSKTFEYGPYGAAGMMTIMVADLLEATDEIWVSVPLSCATRHVQVVRGLVLAAP